MGKKKNSTNEKAVVLLSGGLDSATAAAWAKYKKGWDLTALTVLYGQRHRVELKASRRIARLLNISHHLEIKTELDRIGGSALTDQKINVPKGRSGDAMASGIPVTYVPARNTVMLSLALALAETVEAAHIVLGVNVLDYSGYPDCRPEYIRCFQRLAQLATRAGVEGATKFRIHTPLIRLTKAGIIKLGMKLGVDYGKTWSCYDPVVRDSNTWACGRCDSCQLRIKGFQEAGSVDPLPYATKQK